MNEDGRRKKEHDRKEGRKGRRNARGFALAAEAGAASAFTHCGTIRMLFAALVLPA
jgi:hypothetical protein